MLYKNQGKYTQAEPLLQRGLAIQEKGPGREHANVATVLGNYAGLLREMKTGAAARELEVRAQAIRAAPAQKNRPK
ncbi:MAG: tetratricopeptide repeat protein [Acidobacteriia bacterium]|nr:tetratricopeptide repeat protein [Terriglobia bacterium]